MKRRSFRAKLPRWRSNPSRYRCRWYVQFQFVSSWTKIMTSCEVKVRKYRKPISKRLSSVKLASWPGAELAFAWFEFNFDASQLSVSHSLFPCSLPGFWHSTIPSLSFVPCGLPIFLTFDNCISQLRAVRSSHIYDIRQLHLSASCRAVFPCLRQSTLFSFLNEQGTLFR